MEMTKEDMEVQEETIFEKYTNLKALTFCSSSFPKSAPPQLDKVIELLHSLLCHHCHIVAP